MGFPGESALGDTSPRRRKRREAVVAVAPETGPGGTDDDPSPPLKVPPPALTKDRNLSPGATGNPGTALSARQSRCAALRSWATCARASGESGRAGGITAVEMSSPVSRMASLMTAKKGVSMS